MNVHVPLIGCPSDDVTRHDARYVPAGWLLGQPTVTTPRFVVGFGRGTETPVFVCATIVAVPGIGACENVNWSSPGAFGLMDPSAGEADNSWSCAVAGAVAANMKATTTLKTTSTSVRSRRWGERCAHPTCDTLLLLTLGPRSDDRNHRNDDGND